MRKRYWLGIAVSLLLVYLMARSVQLASVAKAFREADFAFLLPAVALYFAGLFARTLRWGVLLRPVRRLGAKRLFVVLSIGFMANDLLPLRAGEAARAYLLWSKERLDPAATAATIVVERILDGLVLTGFLVAAGLLTRLDGWLTQLAWGAGAVFVAAVVAVVGLAVVPNQMLALVDFMLNPVPPRLRSFAVRVLRGFVDGLGTLRDLRLAVAAVLLSVVAWALEAGMYYSLLFSFPLPPRYLAAVLGTAVANLASMVPSSPGYVGTFDAGLLAVLVGSFSADQSIATAYTALVHAALVLPVTLLGLVFLWREGLSLRRIASRRVPSSGDPKDSSERAEAAPRQSTP
jgi:uncharacterized protein (TIRG00374 family)